MDAHLFHTPDGGEIEYISGKAVMGDGLETAAYLSLFGGNELDSGIEGDDPKEWWGNKAESDPAKKYRSETQHLVQSLPLIPANLRRIEDAATRDLGWMISSSVASSVTAKASMPALNTVKLEIDLEVQDEIIKFAFLTRQQSS